MGATALMPWGEVLLLSTNEGQRVKRWQVTTIGGGPEHRGGGGGGVYGVRGEGQAPSLPRHFGGERPMTQEGQRKMLEDVMIRHPPLHPPHLPQDTITPIHQPPPTNPSPSSSRSQSGVEPPRRASRRPAGCRPGASSRPGPAYPSSAIYLAPGNTRPRTSPSARAAEDGTSGRRAPGAS